MDRVSPHSPGVGHPRLMARRDDEQQCTPCEGFDLDGQWVSYVMPPRHPVDPTPTSLSRRSWRRSSQRRFGRSGVALATVRYGKDGRASVTMCRSASIRPAICPGYPSRDRQCLEQDVTGCERLRGCTPDALHGQLHYRPRARGRDRRRRCRTPSTRTRVPR